MCQKCVDAVKQFWPDLPEKDYDRLLWNATCFPFGTPERVAEQLAEKAEQSQRRLEVAIAIADEETEMAMKGPACPPLRTER